MSLDVYLNLPNVKPGEARKRIFIREDGQNKEITREEWDRRFPDCEPWTVSTQEDGTVFEYNITHNLNRMADLAGVYEALWRPEEMQATHAHHLILPLKKGLEALKQDPEKFKALNPSNGWGNYEGLVAFVEKYLAACEQYPMAEIRVSR